MDASFKAHLDVLDEVGLDVVDELLAGEGLSHPLAHLGVGDEGRQHPGDVRKDTWKGFELLT